ncbi:MAG: hypothetical protein V1754_15360 [Pseudomonadota bacterium]
MFTDRWIPEAREQYCAIEKAAERAHATRIKNNKQKSSRHEGLFKQVRKTINFLLHNPKHPGLETHSYDSLTNPYEPSKKVFEAYAQNNTPAAYRVFWCSGPKEKEITILSITAHP